MAADRQRDRSSPVSLRNRIRLATGIGSWRSTAPIATLSMDVQEDAGLSPRLPAEAELVRPRRGHRARRRDSAASASSIPRCTPSSSRSLKERIFCAGANIFMLRGSTHAWKVNFCKFTNETRLAHGGRERALGHQVPRGAQRHLRRRRLRAGAGLRRDRRSSTTRTRR